MPLYYGGVLPRYMTLRQSWFTPWLFFVCRRVHSPSGIPTGELFQRSDLMNRIETIKAAVSPADAAERYGLKVSRNGRFCKTKGSFFIRIPPLLFSNSFLRQTFILLLFFCSSLNSSVANASNASNALDALAIHFPIYLYLA